MTGKGGKRRSFSATYERGKGRIEPLVPSALPRLPSSLMKRLFLASPCRTSPLGDISPRIQHELSGSAARFPWCSADFLLAARRFPVLFGLEIPAGFHGPGLFQAERGVPSAGRRPQLPPEEAAARADKAPSEAAQHAAQLRALLRPGLLHKLHVRRRGVGDRVSPPPRAELPAPHLLALRELGQ